MAGYSWARGMSNNAVEAYESRGLVPASKVRGVPSALVWRFCSPVEWHHTSAWFNATDFFDPDEVRAIFGLDARRPQLADPGAVAALAAWKEERKAASTIVIHENCHVEWLEWSGSRRRPHATEESADGCRVEVKGNTATITLPDGSSFRKRLTTRGFSFKPAAAARSAA